MDLKRSRNFKLKAGIKSVYDDAITDLRSPIKTVLPGESLTWVLSFSVPSRLTLILNSATFLCSPTKVISMMIFPSRAEIEIGWLGRGLGFHPSATDRK